MMNVPQKLDRILVVNVNWLGDVIFSTAVFKALRANYPQAHIACLALPQVKEILQCVAPIDEIIIYDEKGKDRSLLGKLRLVRQVHRKKFDVVFLLHGSWTRAFLMFLAGIPIRVGTAGKKKENILTHIVLPLAEDAHKADRYLNIIESTGLAVLDRSSELSVLSNARVEIERILADVGIADQHPFIVVHTSGNWDLKRWPQKYWAQLIAVLTRDFKMKVVISEGPKEVQWAAEIARLSGVDPIVLAGRTNVHQLVALLEKAVLVISADSGPLHIASCVSRNIIGLYGPTMPLTTGPRGRARAMILHKDVGCNRASCYYAACPDNVCMQMVTVEDVLETAKHMLRAQ